MCGAFEYCNLKNVTRSLKKFSKNQAFVSLQNVQRTIGQHDRRICGNKQHWQSELISNTVIE